MNRGQSEIGYNEFEYSNIPAIDNRILAVCAKAEADYLINKNFNMSQVKKENYNSQSNFNQPLTKQFSPTSPIINEPPQSNAFFHISKEIKNIPKHNLINNINQNPNILNNKPLAVPISTPQNNNLVNPNNINKNNNIFSPLNYRSPNAQLINKTKNTNFLSTQKNQKQPKIPMIPQNQKFSNPHATHLHSKGKPDINKVLLNAKTLIKKLKFTEAYFLLQSEIKRGVYHSDLFYLYGEVNRILKNLQQAEDYLLLSLNFEMHSPYVFYSLGLLYQETSQFKYSNSFFKLFLQLIESSDAHFQLAKNYSQIGKYIKAAERLTKAINIKKDSIEYYKFRADIYKLIGMTEMANNDENMVNILIDTNKYNNS